MLSINIRQHRTYILSRSVITLGGAAAAYTLSKVVYTAIISIPTQRIITDETSYKIVALIIPIILGLYLGLFLANGYRPTLGRGATTWQQMFKSHPALILMLGLAVFLALSFALAPYLGLASIVAAPIGAMVMLEHLRRNTEPAPYNFF